MIYESSSKIESQRAPGVSYRIARMSFEKRLELSRRILELAQRAEFLDAGPTPRERMEATILGQEMDRVYLQWGLLAVEGLDLDGEPATPEKFIATGPEDLCREALAAIKAESGLTEAERKN